MKTPALPVQFPTPSLEGRSALKKIGFWILALFSSPGTSKDAQESKVIPKSQPSAKTQDADAIEYCHHPRHGTFPQAREFFALSRTETGKVISVFQCTDPRCREYVAAIITRNYGQKNVRVVLRGKNFQSRPEPRAYPVPPQNPATPRRMTPQHRPLVRAKLKPAAALLMAVGISLLFVGCGKSYHTHVSPEEHISKASRVEIDGRDAGKIKRVYVDSTGQQVAEFTTSEPLLRGTVRIRNNGVIALNTGNATAQPLPSGSVIPVESPFSFATKKWSNNALAILALAAVAAVICLRRFLTFQAAAPFLPILAAVGLALVTAYSAHDVAVPTIQKFQSKFRSARPPATVENPAQTMAAGGWNGKARSIENQLVEFLRTPTDSARLLAFVAMFLVTLPVYALLISWLFRKLSYQSVAYGLLFFAAIGVAPSLASDAAYTRDSLRDEQRFAQQSLAEVERDLSAASRFLDSRLAGAPEHLVRALFLTDLAAIRLENQPDRISGLKSAFGYIRSEEQRKLNVSYADLRQQLQAAQLEAAKLSERCNAVTTNQTTVLTVFQAKQADYRELIRAGLGDVKTVLENCNRLVLQTAKAETVEKQENSKTAADMARLQRGQVELQNQLAAMRRIQAQPAAVPAIVMTNIVRLTNTIKFTNLVETVVTSPPLTVVETRIVTNTVVVVTNLPPPHAAITGFLDQTNIPAVVASSTSVPAVVEVVTEEPASSPYSLSTTQGFNLPGSILVGVAALIVVVVLITTTALRQRASEVILFDPATGSEVTLQIQSGSDCVVLDTPPRVIPLGTQGNLPAIQRDWRGRAQLVPGTSGITLNGDPVFGSPILKPNDQLASTAPGTSQWEFRDIARWDHHESNSNPLNAEY